jgi:hypothetical protein
LKTFSFELIYCFKILFEGQERKKLFLCRMPKKHSVNKQVCRVRNQKHSAKTLFAECQKNTQQTSKFAECFILSSVLRAALAKELVCRVPEGLHSANHLALGKEPVSGSES